MLVQERGIDFKPTDDYLQEVRLAGGEDELTSALKSAKVTKPATVDPAVQARQTEIQHHVARGAEFLQRRAYADAEVEYRAAILLDPQNADLHVGLSRALSAQSKTDEALAEAHEAVHFNPESDLGHYSLGYALATSGDIDRAIAEYREALRLNPNSDLAHNGLGLAFIKQGDLDAAISEYREALRLNSNNDAAHSNLGIALGRNGDWDAAMAECQEALRLNPNSYPAHNDLGEALVHKGDLDGAVAQFREALRLNPSYAVAHVDLGVALLKKGDRDGAIAEEREALRLNPNNESAHYVLGVALEQSQSQQEAFQEYRAAYELKPQNAEYRKAYERLLQQRTGGVQESGNEVAASPPAPTRRLVRVKLASGQVVVPALKYFHARFTVDPAQMQIAHLKGTTQTELALVIGSFTVSGGSKNDIEALLLNEDQFKTFSSGQQTRAFYSSGKVTNGQINLGISQAGTYYFVLSNIFSLVSTKYVSAEVELRYLTAP